MRRGLASHGIPVPPGYAGRGDHRRHLRLGKRSAAAPRIRREGPVRAGPPAGRAAGLRLPGPAAPNEDRDPRVPRLQPGTRHAAQGRHAAGPVARHPAPARRQPAVQERPRRRVRAGPGRQLAVRGVRRARHPLSGDLHGLADGRGEERQSRTGHPSIRGVRQGRERREAEDGVGAHLSRHPAGALVRGRRDHRPEGRAGVRLVLPAVRPRTAARHANHRGGVGVRRRLLPAARPGDSDSRGVVLDLDAGGRATSGASIAGRSAFPCWGTSR